MKRHDELRLARALLDRGAEPPRPAGGTARLSNAWHDLELPEPAPPPSGFAERVAACARSERKLLPGFALSPRWASVAAALLLAAGAAGGAGLGAYALSDEEPGEPAMQDVEAALFGDDGLFDDYLAGADEDEPAVSQSSASQSDTESEP